MTERDPKQLLTGGDGKQYSVEELRARVALAEPRIVVLRELPIGAAETLVVMTERVHELVKPFDKWAVVVDLVESAGLMPGPYRKFVPEHMGSLGATHMGMALYMNPVVRGVSRFVAKRIGFNVTVHKDRETAVAAMREALGRG
jgi:hypothetical protein